MHVKLQEWQVLTKERCMVPGEQVTRATHQFVGIREASERRAKLGVKEK